MNDCPINGTLNVPFVHADRYNRVWKPLLVSTIACYNRARTPTETVF